MQAYLQFTVRKRREKNTICRYVNIKEKQSSNTEQGRDKEGAMVQEGWKRETPSINSTGDFLQRTGVARGDENSACELGVMLEERDDGLLRTLRRRSRCTTRRWRCSACMQYTGDRCSDPTHGCCAHGCALPMTCMGQYNVRHWTNFCTVRVIGQLTSPCRSLDDGYLQ